MITITIQHPQQGAPALVLKTVNRAAARGVRLVCNENKLDSKFTEEREPRAIKFKGVD